MLHKLIVLLFISLPCVAHESAQTREAKIFDEFFHNNSAAQKLHQHVQQLELSHIKNGLPLTSAEERKMAQLLIEAVTEEWQLTLAKQTTPSVAAKATEIVKVHLIDRINPVRLGKQAWKWILRKGAYVGVSLLITELIEQAAIIYATTTGENYWIITLSVTHVWDMVGFGLVFGVPALKNQIQLRARFGGYRNLLAHWLKHRKISPFDWNAILTTAEIASASSQRSTLIGIRQSTLLDRVPFGASLKFVFNQKKLASEWGTVIFTIADLEAIAKQSGVDLDAIKAFKSEPKIYSAMLSHSISLNSQALQTITEQIEQKVQTLPRHLAEIASHSPADLQVASLRKLGQNPSYVAQRLQWYYQSHLDFITHIADDMEPEQAKKLNRWIRTYNLLLNDTSAGLASIMSVPGFVDSTQNWGKIEALSGKLEAELTQVHRNFPQLQLGQSFSCNQLLRMR